ncbi:acyl-CoA dehydrogenase family protein [Streptomyces sp. NPDC007991]|uniref:acyl-CoA dehydrogenase family protein n=1 Tax=Streptomyces sp. NPDC007991 TaxID=3364803 RepID=UPI0036EA8396
MPYEEALRQIIEDIVEPEAERVDRDGVFPRKAVEALGNAGLLGLTVPQEAGGGGQTVRAAAEVVRRLAGACGSTAMVVLMHYSATALITAAGTDEMRQDIASGRHLTTLAFSEAGSRSHFWAPMGTATPRDGAIVLESSKSWVTSAGEADSYVWSSRPVTSPDAMTLWLVDSKDPALSVTRRFDGLGLRGNHSAPVETKGLRVSRDRMLGADGSGLDLALTVALPWFLVLNAAASVGLADAVVAETLQHLRGTRLEHLDQSLADQPIARASAARMRIETDSAHALLDKAVDALERGLPEAQLLTLEVKAAAAETSAQVADAALKVCGGAAFRKELGLERRFRDSRAARVMAPTTDALLDFTGRALLGLPLLDGGAR